MIDFCRFSAFLFFIAVFSSALFAECDFDDFPIAPTIETQWLMNGVVYNGVALSVKTFAAQADRETVLDYYRKRWDKEYSESEIDWWRQLIHFENECLLQIQVGEDDKNHAYGRLVMTPLATVQRASLGSGIDLPSETVTVMDMRSDDDYKQGRTLVFTNKMTGRENEAFFRTSLLRRGWVIEMHHSLLEGRVLVAAKKADRISIVIREAAKQTRILYNRESVN
jgi:hypothetical protein